MNRMGVSGTALLSSRDVVEIVAADADDLTGAVPAGAIQIAVLVSHEGSLELFIWQAGGAKVAIQVMVRNRQRAGTKTHRWCRSWQMSQSDGYRVSRK